MRLHAVVGRQPPGEGGATAMRALMATCGGMVERRHG
jgi:hypothetical protein